MPLIHEQLVKDINKILETIVEDSECGIGIHAGSDPDHDEHCWECQRYLLSKRVLDTLKKL
jgi:hypothetical protein